MCIEIPYVTLRLARCVRKFNGWTPASRDVLSIDMNCRSPQDDIIDEGRTVGLSAPPSDAKLQQIGLKSNRPDDESGRLQRFLTLLFQKQEFLRLGE